MTIQRKIFEPYFTLMLFTMPDQVALPFESGNEILNFGFKLYSTVPSGSNYQVEEEMV